MKLILAVSADGYLARGPEDDMSWTGPEDKRVFRLLTLTGGPLLASRRTLEQMPKSLPWRGPLVTVTRSPREKGEMTLEAAHREFGRDCWLLGGPTLAAAALAKDGVVSRVFLCQSANRVLDPGPKGIPAHLVTQLLSSAPHQRLFFDGCEVLFWDPTRWQPGRHDGA